MCLLACFGLFNINRGREGGKEGGKEEERSGNKVVSESSCCADVRVVRGRGGGGGGGLGKEGGGGERECSHGQSER